MFKKEKVSLHQLDFRNAFDKKIKQRFYFLYEKLFILKLMYISNLFMDINQ